MGRKTRVILLSAILGMVLSAPAIQAQEYDETFGDLVGPVGLFAPGDTLNVVGDGFVADSEVLVALMANANGTVVDLGSLSADATGAVDGSVVLPPDVVAGMFTVSATGVTDDGSTRILSSEIEVALQEVADETTTTAAPETTAAPTTAAPTTTTVASDVDVPEALPFEGDSSDGSSNTGLLVGGGVLFLLAIGGVAWWRYQAAPR